MNFMKAINENMISHELLAALQEAADNAAQGIRDPDTMWSACAEMDYVREEMRREVGDLNVTVELLREVRDEK
jgi:hypothetical protein